MIQKKIFSPVIFVSLMLIATIASADGFAHGPRYAVVSATASPAAVSPGGHGELIIKVVVNSGFHINSAHPKDPDLIATVFKPASSSVTFGAAKYPKDEMVTTSAGTVNAYTGATQILVPFTVKRGAKAGALSLAGSLTYQGCNANSCYPPKTDQISASVKVK